MARAALAAVAAALALVGAGASATTPKGVILYAAWTDYPLLSLDIGAKRERILIKDAHDPAWSPSGRLLAYVAGDNIWVARADGSRPARVTMVRDPVRDSRPAWSPDARWLVFRRSREDTGASDLWLARPTGRDLHRIPRTRSAEAPTWSPDGRSIAFFAGAQLDAVPPDGSGRKLLARADGTDPAWSPDGRSIAFTAWHQSEHTGIDLFGVRTGLISPLTDNGGGQVAWSRDGRWLAYAEDRSEVSGPYDEDFATILIIRVADRHVGFVKATYAPFPLAGLAWRSSGPG
jgi:Tol biopolymer transport system component